MFWLTEVFYVIAEQKQITTIYWNQSTTCDNKITKLVMYFTTNLAFTNYLDMLPNMTDSLPLFRDRTRYQQSLPLNLGIPHFDNSLRHRLTKLKDFMTNYVINNKEIVDLQQKHAMESHTLSSNKNFFSSYIVNTLMHLFLL